MTKSGAMKGRNMQVREEGGGGGERDVQGRSGRRSGGRSGAIGDVTKSRATKGRNMQVAGGQGPQAPAPLDGPRPLAGPMPPRRLPHARNRPSDGWPQSAPVPCPIPRPPQAICAACVYLSCRNLGNPRTFREITAILPNEVRCTAHNSMCKISKKVKEHRMRT